MEEAGALFFIFRNIRATRRRCDDFTVRRERNVFYNNKVYGALRIPQKLHLSTKRARLSLRVCVCVCGGGGSTEGGAALLLSLQHPCCGHGHRHQTWWSRLAVGLLAVRQPSHSGTACVRGVRMGRGGKKREEKSWMRVKRVEGDFFQRRRGFGGAWGSGGGRKPDEGTRCGTMVFFFCCC